MKPGSTNRGTISRQRIAALAGAGAALIGAAYGVLLAVETFWAGEPCCGAAWPNPNPIQTERRLAANDPAGADAAVQAAAARNVLRARPTDANGWMRLAYAEALAGGRLTPAGREALRNSYTMTAYAGGSAPWRSAFALQHWGDLDDDLRARAIAEFRAFHDDGQRYWSRRKELAAVTNPEGRAVAIAHDLLEADEFPPPPAGVILRR